MRIVRLANFAAPRSGGLRTVLSWPSEGRRAATRARAEEFGREASVGGFLAAHGVSEAVPA